MASEQKKEWYQNLAFSFGFILLPSILFSLYAGFVEKGLTETEFISLSNFYWLIGVIFAFFLLILVLGNIFGLDKHKGLFGSILSMTMIIDPNKALIGQISKGSNKFMNNFFNVWVLALLIFGAFVLIQSSQNQFFTAFPTGEQQVTPTGKLIYAVYPGADAETLMFIVLTIIQLGVLHYLLVTKGKQKYLTFLLIAILLVPILIGVEGIGLHLLRYSGSELSLLSVFIFWWFNALIYIFSGVSIFWFVSHQLNNLFYYLSQADIQKNVITNESLTLLTIVILLIIVVIWGLVRLRVKKNKIEVETPNG